MLYSIPIKVMWSDVSLLMPPSGKDRSTTMRRLPGSDFSLVISGLITHHGTNGGVK